MKTTTLVHASLLTAVLMVAGCGKSSGLRSSASGGSTGGTSATATGGTTGAGGTIATGGYTASTTSAAGGSQTGGNSARAGSGGNSVVAGAGGASTLASGGSALGGALSSGGTAGTSQPLDAAAGDGGIVASGYCEGDNPKLTYQGQTVTPGATDYQSQIVLDCCDSHGVNLHASAWLGFDIAVELILSIDIRTPNEYEVGSLAARAAVRRSSDALTSMLGVNAVGSLRVLGMDTTTKTWGAGLCLEVVNASSDLVGTTLYVPKVTIGSFESRKRFQLFLLKDSKLRSDGVANLPLDDLVLTEYPVLDLDRIAFVEKATSKFGFNPGQKIGDSLRTQLGTPLGLPFVVVADGVRIYLGTFYSDLSSIPPAGPVANMGDITSDGFTLRAPWSGADPRSDERIVKALTETGKLVP